MANKNEEDTVSMSPSSMSSSISPDEPDVGNAKSGFTTSLPNPSTIPRNLVTEQVNENGSNGTVLQSDSFPNTEQNVQSESSKDLFAPRASQSQDLSDVVTTHESSSSAM